MIDQTARAGMAVSPKVHRGGGTPSVDHPRHVHPHGSLLTRVSPIFDYRFSRLFRVRARVRWTQLSSRPAISGVLGPLGMD